MKSKHIVTYGEKVINCDDNSYHIDTVISHKSTIAALCTRSAVE